MPARLRICWAAIRDSLWFIPAAMTLIAACTAVLLVELERNSYLDVGDTDHWLFGGGVESGRQVLSVIATGLITVTGVVFSVTTVALQLASSQFTPRVLRNFTSDRSSQVVLGVFISTFTYALLVLRAVQSDTSTQGIFVPRVAFLGAVMLAMLSIGCLIYYINHAARSMQIAYILQQVTVRTIQVVEELFPEPTGCASEPPRATQQMPGGSQSQVFSQRSGYLQAVDSVALSDIGVRKQLHICMQRKVGGFVRRGQVIATVWPADSVDEATLNAVRSAFVFGLERTPEQDIEFGIIEIADIAVKALSPGINDPTTALLCIDRLGEILALLAIRRPPQDTRTRSGVAHFHAIHPTFDELVHLAFDQIRFFGGGNPAIANKLVATLESLAEITTNTLSKPLRELAAEIALRGSNDASDMASGSP